MTTIEVPFQMLKNNWIWYPSRNHVFWLETELIDAVNKYSISTPDKELLQSEYCKKYTSLGSLPHIEQLQNGIKLWDSIKKNGFNKDIGTFKMNITEEGRLEVIDGFHRLIILNYLNYDGLIRIDILNRDNRWLGFKNNLKQLGNLYTPIPHPDVSISSWYRIDSMERLETIRSEIGIVNNIVDMGACEGFISFGLFDKVREHIHSIEENSLRFEVASYLNKMYNRHSDRIVFHKEKIENYMNKTEVFFDVGVFLSTFHHLLIHNGVQAWTDLKNLSNRIETLFFSVAMENDSVWKNHRALKGLNIKTIPELIKIHWGYNKYKILPVKCNDGRIIFKFWERGTHE